MLRDGEQRRILMSQRRGHKRRGARVTGFRDYGRQASGFWVDLLRRSECCQCASSDHHAVSQHNLMRALTPHTLCLERAYHGAVHEAGNDGRQAAIHARHDHHHIGGSHCWQVLDNPVQPIVDAYVLRSSQIV